MRDQTETKTQTSFKWSHKDHWIDIDKKSEKLGKTKGVINHPNFTLKDVLK